MSDQAQGDPGSSAPYGDAGQRAKQPPNPASCEVRGWLRVVCFAVLMAIAAGGLWKYHTLAVEWDSYSAREGFTDFAPLYARADVHLRGLQDADARRDALIPIALGVLWIAVTCAATFWLRVPAFPMAILATAFALAMNIAVARIDGGNAALVGPFEREGLEYFHDAPMVRPDVRTFLREYPKLQNAPGFFRRHILSVHAGTHPPGPVLFQYFVRHYIADSLWAGAMTAIVVSALGAGLTYLLARQLAGDAAAAAAAGLYVVTPNLVLFGATCMDGVFLVLPVLVWLLMFVAFARRSWSAGLVIAATGGLVLAASMLMTFSTLCVGLIMTAYGVITLIHSLISSTPESRRESLKTIMTLGVIAASFFLSLWAFGHWTGFDLPGSIRSAIQRNNEAVGTGAETWNRYFDVSAANLAAFLMYVGLPALALFLMAVGTSLKPRSWASPARRLTLAFALSLLGIAFGRWYTLETERVWVFMSPLLAVGAGQCFVSVRWGRWMAVAILCFAIAGQLAQTWTMEWLLYTWW